MEIQLQTVNIPVARPLKEYIISSTGSDVIIPAKDSPLWAIIKQYLVSNKESSACIAELNQDLVKVAIRNVHAATIYNFSSSCTMQINTICRATLSRKGERIIARLLNKDFKRVFIAYMLGCLNNSEMQIQEAIEEFCTDHNIELTDTVYQMLKKCWYRWNKKDEIVKKKTIAFSVI